MLTQICWHEFASILAFCWEGTSCHQFSFSCQDNCEQKEVLSPNITQKQIYSIKWDNSPVQVQKMASANIIFLTFLSKTERNLYRIVYSHDQKDQICISCCEFMPSLHVCLCLHKNIFIVHTLHPEQFGRRFARSAQCIVGSRCLILGLKMSM